MFAFASLLLGLASNPNPTSIIKIKTLCFGINPIQIGIKNRQGEITERSIYTHSFSPYFIVHCPENKLTLYRSQASSTEGMKWSPWVSTSISSSGGNFLAIVSETPTQPTLHLLPDPNYLEEGGVFHVFNLSTSTIAIDFPGQKKVLTRGQRTQFRPKVKNATYGQGRFTTVDEANAETKCSGVRWLQMEDTRLFWFILPPSSEGPSFILKNIEDQIFAP